jgi:hypothetical protein
MSSRYRNDLTAEKVRSLFDYEPETGIFTWKVDRSTKVKAGDVVGYININDGYRYTKINGTSYLVHRLIWLWQTGSWPREEMDHVNRIRNDNRLANLREATPSENAFNSSPNKDKPSSLPRGIYPTSNGKFRAGIGSNFFIGTFGPKNRFA